MITAAIIQSQDKPQIDGRFYVTELQTSSIYGPLTFTYLSVVGPSLQQLIANLNARTALLNAAGY
jgi:hypothetical protein